MGWLLLLGVRTLSSVEGQGVIIKTALGLELRVHVRVIWWIEVCLCRSLVKDHIDTV